MNRADPLPASYLRVLREGRGVPESVSDAVSMLEGESASRTAAADAFCADLRARLPGPPQVRLPYLDAASPAAVVTALSTELDVHLDTLLPRSG